MTNKLNENHGLQRKEFSEKVGLTDRQVLHYCELHVFKPTRPDDAPNNRRFFTETDFKAAELIQILLKLGHNPVEIGRIFEENNHDLDLILDTAIKRLKKRIMHDRNLVMAAEYAQTVGTSLFTFSDMSDSDIDKFANAIRKSEVYKNSKLSLRKLSSEETALNEGLKSTILRFAELAPILNDDAQFSDNFYRVETLVDDYVSKFSEIIGIGPLPIMLGLGTIYSFGDGMLCSNADEIGGVGTSEFMGLSFLLTWLKHMSRLVFPLILLLNNKDNNNKQTHSILNELLKLFETESIVITSSTDISFSDDDCSASIGLVEVLFDFAKELSSDQGLMDALYIDRDYVPSVEQLDNTLALLNEYVNGSLKGKEM